MYRQLRSLLCVGVSMIPTAVFAQPPEHGGPANGPRGMRSGPPMQVILQLFDQADANQDGSLTKEELTAALPNHAPGDRPQRAGSPPRDEHFGSDRRAGRPTPHGQQAERHGRPSGPPPRDEQMGRPRGPSGPPPHDGDDRQRFGGIPGQRGPEHHEHGFDHPGHHGPAHHESGEARHPGEHQGPPPHAGNDSHAGSPQFGPPPEPGQLLPEHIVESLDLNEQQQEQLAALQADVDERLAAIFTDVQRDLIASAPNVPHGPGPGHLRRAHMSETEGRPRRPQPFARPQRPDRPVDAD